MNLFKNIQDFIIESMAVIGQLLVALEMFIQGYRLSPALEGALGQQSIMKFVDLKGVDQSSSEACGVSCDGGVARFMIIECEGIDLAASSFDPVSGCITGLATTGVGIGAEYVPDKDNTATLNFIGELVGSTQNVNIEGFAKFKCITKDKVTEANKLKKLCCIYIVAEMNDCNVTIAGIDVLTNCSVAGELRPSKEELKAIVSLLWGTGEEESRMELTFEGVQRCFTLVDKAVLTYDDIKASIGL